MQLALLNLTGAWPSEIGNFYWPDSAVHRSSRFAISLSRTLVYLITARPFRQKPLSCRAAFFTFQSTFLVGRCYPQGLQRSYINRRHMKSFDQNSGYFVMRYKLSLSLPSLKNEMVKIPYLRVGALWRQEREAAIALLATRSSIVPFHRYQQFLIGVETSVCLWALKKVE